ncbi:hypothetical protein QYZ88_009245 [Lachnospiraceae bacterium C1.1]|nr:hypothetical protein [Lachnospiraceae bacterium C1.1]
MEQEHQLKDAENKLFEKYIKNAYLKKNMADVNMQGELYEKLLTKNLEETAVKELYDLTMIELDNQYSRKNQIEIRFGFLITLWGIILKIFHESGASKELMGIFAVQNVNYKSVFAIIAVAAAFISLIFVALGILTRKYNRVGLIDDKESNFNCAIDDKKLFYVGMLVGVTAVFEGNEKIINNKAKKFNYALNATCIFLVSTIVLIM